MAVLVQDCVGILSPNYEHCRVAFFVFHFLCTLTAKYATAGAFWTKKF